jgi:hypothetical protein
VANTLSIGFEVRRWSQCSAGNRAQFVCAYEMGFGVDDLPEAVFLVQGETDELWIIRHPADGLLEMLAAGGELSPLTARNAVTARHQPDRQRSAAVLLDALFEAGVGFCWPTRHLISGIIDRDEIFRRTSMHANTRPGVTLMRPLCLRRGSVD